MDSSLHHSPSPFANLLIQYLIHDDDSVGDAHLAVTIHISIQRSLLDAAFEDALRPAGIKISLTSAVRNGEDTFARDVLKSICTYANQERRGIIEGLCSLHHYRCQFATSVECILSNIIDLAGNDNLCQFALATESAFQNPTNILWNSCVLATSQQ